MSLGNGFSHVGVSTHDMAQTIFFYEDVLGLQRVVDSLTHVDSGGSVREVYFSLGDNQYIVFMELQRVPGIPPGYDTSINTALGVPRGLYHFSFRVPTLEALDQLRQRIATRGVEVSDIIDLGHAKSIFFFDPNGLQLEYCCQTRPFNVQDLQRESTATLAE